MKLDPALLDGSVTGVKLQLSNPLNEADITKIDSMLLVANERSIALDLAELRQWGCSQAELDAYAANKRENFRARRQSDLRRIVAFVDQKRAAGALPSVRVQ